MFRRGSRPEPNAGTSPESNTLRKSRSMSVATQAAPPADVVRTDGSIAGWLSKKGGGLLLEKWQKRYFQQKATLLAYFDSSVPGTKPKGAIDLLQVTSIDSYGSANFEVTVPGRTYYLKARSGEERDRWVELLRQRCVMAKGDSGANKSSPGSPASPRQPAVASAEALQSASLFSIPFNQIQMIKQIGRGSFGAVHLGLYDNQFAAIKVAAEPEGRGGEAANFADEFVREARLMHSIPDHPCVTKMFGMCIEQGKYALVMEYCPRGGLDAFLRAAAKSSETLLPNLSPNALWKFAYGIASGMAHLCKNGIVHRDLAARNVLVGTSLFPKISDFGFSRKVDVAEQENKTASLSGPIRWMAPEAFRHSVYSEKTDIWSFGCVLVELITGKLPFYSVADKMPNLSDIFFAVRDHGFNCYCDLDTLLKNGSAPTLPNWYIGLIMWCFSQDPAQRPTFAAICDYLERERPELKDSFYIEVREGKASMPKINNAASVANAKGNSSSSSSSSSTVVEAEDSVLDITKLQIISKLGEGSFGAVYLGQVGNGTIVAVKQWTGSGDPGGLHREAAIMTSLPPHRNVVRMYGLVAQGETISLVMKFVRGGSLDSYVARISQQFGRIPFDLAYKLCLGIARGMSWLSKHNIVHRDLSARNVLVDIDSTPLIADFGLSRALKDGQEQGKTVADVGPLRWMAPECFASRTYSEKSDVWAYACTVWEIITGRLPFPEVELINVVPLVRDQRKTTISGIDLSSKPSVDQFFLQLMEPCLAYDPSDRPRFEEIVETLLVNAPAEVLAEERLTQKKIERSNKVLDAINSIGI